MGKLPKIVLTWRVSFWLNPKDDGLVISLPENLLLAIRRSRDYLIDNHISVYTSNWSLNIDDENFVHFRLDVSSQDTTLLQTTNRLIEKNMSVLQTTG
jgi:hypothetical protein